MKESNACNLEVSEKCVLAYVCVERERVYMVVWMWMINKWGTMLTVIESGQRVYGSFLYHCSFSVSLKLCQSKVTKDSLYSNHYSFFLKFYSAKFQIQTSWKSSPIKMIINILSYVLCLPISIAIYIYFFLNHLKVSGRHQVT